MRSEKIIASGNWPEVVREFARSFDKMWNIGVRTKDKALLGVLAICQKLRQEIPEVFHREQLNDVASGESVSPWVFFTDDAIGPIDWEQVLNVEQDIARQALSDDAFPVG